MVNKQSTNGQQTVNKKVPMKRRFLQNHLVPRNKTRGSSAERPSCVSPGKIEQSVERNRPESTFPKERTKNVNKSLVFART